MAYVSTEPRKINRTSLAAAIAVNGAVLAALITAVPEMREVIERTLIAYPVPEPKPPEPLPEPPKPRPETRSEAPLRVNLEVDVPVLPDLPTVTLTDTPTVTIDPNPGTGTADIIEPPARPAPPLLVRAEIDPRFARDFQPDYPPAKIRVEEEGRVTVRVLIGANGRVRRIEPVGSVDSDFFATTRRQALSKWRFTPATRDGVAIEGWREISVRFELNR